MDHLLLLTIICRTWAFSLGSRAYRSVSLSFLSWAGASYITGALRIYGELQMPHLFGFLCTVVVSIVCVYISVYFTCYIFILLFLIVIIVAFAINFVFKYCDVLRKPFWNRCTHTPGIFSDRQGLI